MTEGKILDKQNEIWRVIEGKIMDKQNERKKYWTNRMRDGE